MYGHTLGTVLKSRDSCLVHQDVGNQEHGKSVWRLAFDVGTLCSHDRDRMLIRCSSVGSAMLSVLELNKTLQNKPNGTGYRGLALPILAYKKSVNKILRGCCVALHFKQISEIFGVTED